MFDAILGRGAVWRCGLAIVFDLRLFRQNWVRRAERSCEDVAIRCVSSSRDVEGTTEKNDTGSGYAEDVDVGVVWVQVNERMGPS